MYSGPTSLGSFGGYITYYYENAIYDDPNHPYGVDFIIHGNSVDGGGGFAEPGQVWVSEDGENWYALAGSLHYEDCADWNKNHHIYQNVERQNAGNVKRRFKSERLFLSSHEKLIRFTAGRRTRKIRSRSAGCIFQRRAG